MVRLLAMSLLGVGLAAGRPAVATAQGSPADGWSPPSREMPTMPAAEALRGDWRTALGGWMRGVEAVSGADAAQFRASGDARPGSPRVRFVRVTSGPYPVAAWSDRNGDGRADLIELFRTGTAVAQVVDADFDGRADVVRYHTADGALVREERLR